jgi:hypothetical protein
MFSGTNNIRLAKKIFWEKEEKKKKKMFSINRLLLVEIQNTNFQIIFHCVSISVCSNCMEFVKVK